MTENTHSAPAAGTCAEAAGARPGKKVQRKYHRKVTAPSPRAVTGVLAWIDDAETANRTWARNLLAVLAIIVALFLLAFRTGLLPH